jgi:hypothetical protein
MVSHEAIVPIIPQRIARQIGALKRRGSVTLFGVAARA